MTNARTCTVSFLKTLEVPTLNYAGCTLTFALAGNIDLVTRGEYVCLYEIAYIVSVCVSKTEFFKSFLWCYTVLVKKALHWLCNLVWL